MLEDSHEPADPQETPAEPSPSGGESLPEAAAQAVTSEVESLRNDLVSMKDRYLRSLADCQNIQKRAMAERDDAVRRAQAELARALLPVLDNFERTLAAARSAQNIQTVTEGVRIVYDQMVKVLGDFGVQRIALAKGDAFDPAVHQAIAQQPTDEVEPEQVLVVAQAGYTMRDRLLRAATVVVAKAPSASS
jgi:molecular chaperone GrpE